jgi:periplasmic protein TonB
VTQVFRFVGTDNLSHMSLSAAATSGLIHALAALALLWTPMLRPVETLQRAIDVTILPLSAAPSSPVPSSSSPAVQPESPATGLTQPTLEEQLAPVADLPPLSTQEFGRGVPTTPPASPSPRPNAAQASRREAVQALQAERAPNRHPEEDYLMGMIQKLSRYHFLSARPQSSLHGVVVSRVTLARDGRLLDVTLLKSSGFPALDQAVLDTIRRASPFAPLPDEIVGPQLSLTVPIAYERER